MTHFAQFRLLVIMVAGWISRDQASVVHLSRGPAQLLPHLLQLPDPVLHSIPPGCWI